MEEARWTLAMCQRFHCLPSQLLAEPAEFLTLLSMLPMAREGL